MILQLLIVLGTLGRLSLWQPCLRCYFWNRTCFARLWFWAKTWHTSHRCHLYHYRSSYLRRYHASFWRYGLADTNSRETIAQTSGLHHILGSIDHLLFDSAGWNRPRCVHPDAHHLRYFPEKRHSPRTSLWCCLYCLAGWHYLLTYCCCRCCLCQHLKCQWL